eukprot:m.168904 g.168904  ORF g.168904 m.168904 type:complete len:284 (+) comp13021_c0_seq1:476-1327(+)
MATAIVSAHGPVAGAMWRGVEHCTTLTARAAVRPPPFTTIRRPAKRIPVKISYPSLHRLSQGVGRVMFLRRTSYPGGSQIDWPYELRRLKGVLARHRTLQAMNRLVNRRPLIMAGVTTAGRYGFGDTLVQAMTNDGEGWDIQRTCLFTVFGFVYASTAGYTIYNVLYPRIMGASRPYTTALFDVLTHNPFVYFPSFYVAKSFAFSPVSEWTTRGREIAEDGLKLWRYNFNGDVMTAMLFWLPMHCVNFRLVPLHFRLPFMAAIGCGWVAILSSRNGSRPDEEQ